MKTSELSPPLLVIPAVLVALGLSGLPLVVWVPMVVVIALVSLVLYARSRPPDVGTPTRRRRGRRARRARRRSPDREAAPRTG